MFTTSTYPRSFKSAQLFPIHKSGDPTKIQNYRPISLLPVLNKLVEKIIASQINKYVTDHKLLNENQFGFREGRACENAAHELLGYISENIEKRKNCIAVFCDVSRAFDTVCRDRLLGKLERMGIRGGALRLMTAYLSDRTQIFKVGDAAGEKENIGSGVPQGSVLAPHLFNLYMNDLFTVTGEYKTVLFADDAVMVVTGVDADTTCDAASDLITRVNEWMRTNGLLLNISKTKVMSLQPGQRRPLTKNVKIHTERCRTRQGCDCPALEQVEEYKYFGLIIQSNLKFEQHIAKSPKASGPESRSWLD